MNIEYFYNPFKYLAGIKSMLTGVIILVITAWLGKMNNVHFDGIIDVHFGKSVPVLFFISESLLDWLVISIFLYVAALILSESKVRIVDVFGTQAFARIPMLFISLVCFIPFFHFTFKGIPAIDLKLLIFLIITLFFTVWSITLMYNAYTVSANLKGPKAIASFIIVFVISEIVAKIMIIQVLGKFIKH